MTSGVTVVATVVMHLDLPYCDVAGTLYIALSSALACRVFRMLRLGRDEAADGAFSTRAVESMIMAIMTGCNDERRRSWCNNELGVTLPAWLQYGRLLVFGFATVFFQFHTL